MIILKNSLNQLPIKLTQIEEFKLDDDKGCFITGELGTGKTCMCKGLQQEILNSVRHGNFLKYVHHHINQL